jgi:hypothetical protein
MTESIEFRYRPRETVMQGERVVILESEIPDNAPPDIKEGLNRRAIVHGGGTCPCGARMILPTPVPQVFPRNGCNHRSPVPHPYIGEQGTGNT